MQANKRKIYSAGSVSLEDIPNEEINTIIELLQKVLPKLTQNRPHEDSLTQRLVQLALAEQNPLLKWIFIKDNENEYKSQEDIGVSPQNDPLNIFFVLEAKRLDASLPKNRKKEYVIGRKGQKKYINSGGIERFKKEIHAKDMIFAGMIGYVQTDSFLTWENKINDLIEQEMKKPTSKILSWNLDDKLVYINSTSKLAKFTSNHMSISKKYISLTHLWVDLK